MRVLTLQAPLQQVCPAPHALPLQAGRVEVAVERLTASITVHAVGTITGIGLEHRQLCEPAHAVARRLCLPANMQCMPGM